jgi:hypothetical protein
MNISYKTRKEGERKNNERKISKAIVRMTNIYGIQE